MRTPGAQKKIVTFTILQLWLMGTASEPHLHTHEGFITRLLNKTSVFNSTSNVMTYFCKRGILILLWFMPQLMENQPSICSDCLILTCVHDLSGYKEKTLLRVIFSISTPLSSIVWKRTYFKRNKVLNREEKQILLYIMFSLNSHRGPGWAKMSSLHLYIGWDSGPWTQAQVIICQLTT